MGAKDTWELGMRVCAGGGAGGGVGGEEVMGVGGWSPRPEC